ncbi:hypothetical protein K435DRAFT_25292 [Dendrothele bispora CBS 962.96]|uniref:GPI-anchored wall transfer protein 1 n=1 Tax=Dendrothele bispora (strain CBS 962.96) TaxID=1314807 RepID=A0A4S8MSW3_DENBC|nr:hypothetical protein K435DRAFT_25292 [Dendrothele bispora CBS 962.96]
MSYKASKEAFVTGMTGSSIAHINLVSSVALASIFLYYALQTRKLISNKSLVFASIVLALPLLLCMTLFAMHPIALFLLFAVPAMLICLTMEKKESRAMLPSSATVPTFAASGTMERKLKITQLPALTTYRAHMLLMTMFAILAVDFPVFPREMVKCETFGVSLMDIGVGSFVFSSGVVSAIPIIKNPSHLTAPMIPKVITVIRKCLPIISLGVIRVLLVKGTEYPEHETEYGTHWNFFITLALLPVMQVLLHPLLARVSVTGLGVVVALAQQYILLSPNGLDLRSYVLDVPRDRTNFISANKEGIVSLTGYFAIHLLGLATGTLILPPSPSYFRRAQKTLNRRLSSQKQAGNGKKVLKRRDNSDSESDSESGNSDNEAEAMRLAAPRQNDKTAAELCAYAVVWWVLTGIFGYINSNGAVNVVERKSWGVSRRLVNLPYIFWICAYNVSFILGYLLLDMLFYPVQERKQKKTKASPPASPTLTTFQPLSPSASVNPRPSSPLSSLHPVSPTPRPVSPLLPPRSPSFRPSSPTWPDHSHHSVGPRSGSSSISYNVEDIPPPLLEAINKNGLLLFLVANLLTGVVNLSIQTMYASDTFSMIILCGYGWTICALAWWGRRRKIVQL